MDKKGQQNKEDVLIEQLIQKRDEQSKALKKLLLRLEEDNKRIINKNKEKK